MKVHVLEKSAKDFTDYSKLFIVLSMFCLFCSFPTAKIEEGLSSAEILAKHKWLQSKEIQESRFLGNGTSWKEIQK